jgi:hypothetical protein
MSTKIVAAERRIKTSFLSMDFDRMSENLRAILMDQSQYFRKPLDAGDWELYVADGKKSGRVSPGEAIRLVRECPSEAIIFRIRLLAVNRTPNMGLELIPEEYISVAINLSKRELIFAVSVLGEENANTLFKLAMEGITLFSLQIPEEHRYLEPYIKKLLDDYSPLERNVFLIMRFKNEPPFSDIVDTIQSVCKKRGLNISRSDDKSYSDDLWDNVMTYMYGSTYAIAVFDQINYREFNPNVALEVGFMLAQNKRILLLKDQAIPVMPTDIIGKIYKSFDTYRPRETIPPQLEKWFIDCGL